MLEGSVFNFLKREKIPYTHAVIVDNYIMTFTGNGDYVIGKYLCIEDAEEVMLELQSKSHWDKHTIRIEEL